MYNFCTLFDKNYLYKGLTLYTSLQKHNGDFHLWILCMDNTTYSLLNKMQLKNVTLISLREFENERLLSVKKERTVAEYSWTAAANLLWHMMKIIKDEETITYLDSDMYFFADPKIVYEEIGGASIAIVEHRLQGIMKKLEKFVGKYNVGWISMKKDVAGLKTCEWWKDKVLDWCFARFEGGKLGDQHYLNDWPTRFKNVQVIKHLGADVAPWNINNEKISIKNNQVYIADKKLIFYHFHNFILINKNKFLAAPASHIPAIAREHIYKEYFREMKLNINTIQKLDPQFNSGFKKKYFKSFVANIFLKNKFLYSLYIKYTYHKLEKSYA